MDPKDLVFKAARQLGYHERDGLMMKPFGYSCVVIKFIAETPPWSLIRCYFKDLQGKISIYQDDRVYDEGDSLDQILQHIKTFEAYTRVSIGDPASDFRLPGTEHDL